MKRLDLFNLNWIQPDNKKKIEQTSLFHLQVQQTWQE